jgi:hypothetical protein
VLGVLQALRPVKALLTIWRSEKARERTLEQEPRMYAVEQKNDAGCWCVVDKGQSEFAAMRVARDLAATQPQLRIRVIAIRSNDRNVIWFC